MANELAGKVAIITGSAGGIGRALTEELAKRGCHVVLADINEELLERTAADLRATGAKLDAKTIDVRDADQVQQLVDGTFRELGRIDYMFNNAGINVLGELRDTSLEDWNDLIDTNLRGVVHGVHAVYPIMREQGFGHIVNTASMAGLAPTPGEGAYSATKYAVVGLSAALRIEAEAFGVRVSVVCPGLVETPLIDTTRYVKFDREAIRKLAIEKAIAPRTAARVILRGVDRNRFFIVFTRTAHVMWGIHRYAPETSVRLGKFAIRQFRNVRHDDD